MSLAVETSGTGPDLVMLHGWGLHGGFFASLVPHLGTHFRVHRVDLPGHGRSLWSDTAPSGLVAWTDAVREVVPARAVWLGWSLGGLVAMDAALRLPDAVRALVLVAATPRFVTAEDWPHAQRPGMLVRFADGLKQDFHKTVSDFLTLQSLGDAHAREQVRLLRPILFGHGDPHPDGLAEGLRILRDTDLRPHLADARVPALFIAGQRDRLTPPEAMQVAAAAWPEAHYEAQAGAAHTPFLSDPAGFAARVVEFVHAHG